MSRAKAFLAIFVFTLWASCARATPSIVSASTNTCASSSASTLGCAMAANVSNSGDTGVLVISQGISSPGTLPSSVTSTGSGCPSLSWKRANSTWPYNDVLVYVAYGLTAGSSCTPSATFGSSSQMIEHVFEITGVPANYGLEAFPLPFGRANCCQTVDFFMQGSDLALGIANAGPGAGTCSGTPTISGWTLAATTCSGSEELHTWYMTGTAGAQSFATNLDNTFGINATGTVVVFRPSVPSPGRVQANLYNYQSNAQAYNYPNQAGDRLMAICENDGTTAPTDTEGDTWIITPILITSDSTDYYDVWTVNSAVGGANTVTCSGSGSGIQLLEYTSTHLGASSVYFTDNTSITTIPAGTVTANSNSVVVSIGAVVENTTATMTASSGFANYGAGATPNGANNGDIFTIWEENVAAGSVSNTFTPSSAADAPQGMLLVLESSPITVPILKQRERASAGAGADGSRTATAIGAIAAGDLIIVPLTNQTTSAGPGTFSDSLSDPPNVFFSLGTSNGYALAWFIASSNVAAGSYTVTNTNAQCIALLDIGVPTAPAQDTYVTATNLSGASSLGTGNLTTAEANEFLLSFSTVDSASDRLLFTSQSSGWSGLGLTCGGHDASLFAGMQPQVATGTYANTFTWADSMPITATILAFKVATPTQPNVFWMSEEDQARELSGILTTR